LALTVLMFAQAMITLDIVVVNVALPSAQKTLHIPPAGIQWVVTAYLLPFGALLLLGGRIADYTGRRRAFLLSALGFALASAIGGGAQTEALLFASRALQGLFAAVMAPSLLSMLTLGFPDDRDRRIALALYTVVGATGGALGLILGGVLTQYLSWRWCLLINVPISVLVVAGGARLLPESRAGGRPHYDLFGAAAATLGVLGLIYGISRAAVVGWGQPETLVPIAIGLAVLAGFLFWEARIDDPLLPLALLRNRTRAAGLLAVGGAFGPSAGMLLILLVFLQSAQHESPLTAGIVFLPYPLAAALAAAIVLPLLGRLPPRPILLTAALIAAAGSLLLIRLEVGSGYAWLLLPALAVFSGGIGVMFLAGNSMALTDVPTDDSGVVGAAVNAIQQIAGALATAVLATVAASGESHYLASHGNGSVPAAITHGDHVAVVVVAALYVLVGVICAAVAPSERLKPVAASTLLR